MEKLGSQSKAENQKIAVETSKAIAGHCDALQTQVKELEKEAQSQAADCMVSDARDMYCTAGYMLTPTMHSE